MILILEALSNQFGLNMLRDYLELVFTSLIVLMTLYGFATKNRAPFLPGTHMIVLLDIPRLRLQILSIPIYGTRPF